LQTQKIPNPGLPKRNPGLNFANRFQRMARICLLTSGQPSTNPRLVKEADALVEAGHEVHVIGAHWTSWADETDKELVPTRFWSSWQVVGGHPAHAPLEYAWTRVRHRLSRQAIRFGVTFAQKWAGARASVDLHRAAQATRAELYIGHNLGALAPAVEAARTHHSLVGFDIEDFHTSMNHGSTSAAETRLAELLERKYLGQCDYLTASSSGIAQAYSDKYQVNLPVTIHNVFPMSQRPSDFRQGRADQPMTLYWFSQTIGDQRGLETIVRALGLVSGLEIELHLRGSVKPGYREQLINLALEAGVNPSRIFFHPPALPDDMVRLSSLYDIGMALEPRGAVNTEMCISNKLFTYLIAGNAIMATNTPGQRSVIDAVGRAGVCFDEADVQGMALQLRYWFANREALEQSRREAWHWATVCFNWDLEKRKFLDLIDGVCGNRLVNRQASSAER
jgi:glycosyltransferase involved in cell wall biosynthesis